MDMKDKTIQPTNIIQTTDGYFRFVNHDDQLLTTGFKTKEKLLEYADKILFIDSAVKIMRERYNKFTHIERN